MWNLRPYLYSFFVILWKFAIGDKSKLPVLELLKNS